MNHDSPKEKHFSIKVGGYVRHNASESHINCNCSCLTFPFMDVHYRSHPVPFVSLHSAEGLLQDIMGEVAVI